MLYKDLLVWQKAHSLALKTISVLKDDRTERSYIKDMVTKQLLRSVTSVGANIAEGYGRHKGKEYVRFLKIAYGSANETDNWLNIMKDAKLMQEDVAGGLLDDNEEILKILATIIRRLEEKG